jgi:hypothetical protein
MGVLFLPPGTSAQIPKSSNDPVSRRQTISPKLLPSEPIVPLAEAAGVAPAGVTSAWQRFVREAAAEWGASVDRRSGEIAVVSGAGLPWIEGGREGDLARLEGLARELLARHGALLGVDPGSVRLNAGRSGQLAPHLWAVDFDVVVGETPIEGTRVVFRINNGRLIQFGTENLPSPGASAPAPVLDREAARKVVDLYLGGGTPGGFTADDEFLDGGSLHLIPINLDVDKGQQRSYLPGKGRGLARVWQFIFRRKGVTGTFRARVDAATGELLELQDINRYAQATGGVASDIAAGTEVTRPMPFADLGGGVFTNSAGLYTFSGTALTSALNGQFVRINDTCGAISLTTDGSGNLVFGTAAGSDCATPGSGGVGNTRSARTSFYFINRAKELARGWLSAPWFSNQVTATVNQADDCNGYWNGTSIDLFRATAGLCGASGEEPGFILHEMGHGFDENDGNGASEGATGESYGDLNAAIVLHNSCVAAGFWLTNCTGYGDACTSCSGLRDIDWARHASNTPHTVGNFTQANCFGGGGPCGGEVHCESYVPSEAVWDFVNRDLPSPGTDAAWAIAERLFYSSRPTATTAYTCNTAVSPWTSNGCNIGSLWNAFRTLDDDDGDLTNGTPHGGALFAAFNRHGMACATDLGASTTHSVCTPPAIPTLTVTGGTNQVTVSWTSAGAGMVYDVFRSELGCDAAFTRIATASTATSFLDTAVANGSIYSYQVVAYPSGNAACAAPPSSCLSSNLSGADPSIRPWGAALDPPTPPFWQTSDIWVDNDADGVPNEAGEPSRGATPNQLFARITNSGNAATGGYRVSFSAKPYTTSAMAPAAAIGHVDEPGPLAPGASHPSQVAWDLSNTWVHANFDSMFWSATHYCVVVSIGPAGTPLTDVDLTNNSAQSNFDNIPLAGGVAHAEFFIYNHLDQPADASLEGVSRVPGWTVRFQGIADPAHIPLGPKQWLPVTAVAVPSPDAPQPRKGAPIFVEVSQRIDGETVGGLTFAVQPPDFGQPGQPDKPGTPRTWLGVRGGGGWPLSPMTDRFDPGFLFAVDLERALAPHLRLGVEAGYHSFASFAVEPPASGELGVTNLSLFARWLSGTGPWQPYLMTGLGAYRAGGSWKAGLELGAGLELPISNNLALSTGVAAHGVEGTPVGDLRWIEAFLGFRAALP